MLDNGNAPKILLNDDALQESFVPSELTARQEIESRILACLPPAAKDHRPTHLWLHGQPGSGKTCAARAALGRLARDAGIRSVSVNCWERDSLYEILDQMVEDLKIFRAEEHRSSVKLQRLRKCLAGTCLIVLLDEIDKIAPSERSRAIYSLTEFGNVGIICVSNSLTPLYEIEDRARSRLNPRTIAFEPYTCGQILEILTRRAELALSSGTCPAYLLKRMATVCSGDARVAIQTLRNAAVSAERQRHEAITSSDVAAGWHDCQKAGGSQLLANLTEDHRMLHQIVTKQKGVLSTELRELYLQQCSGINRKPIAPRTFSGYIVQLVRLKLLACERARVKGNVYLLRPAR